MATTNDIIDSTSNMAQGGSPTYAPRDGTIIQTERLFTARSRAASYLGTPNALIERGPHAYVKLLTSQTQYAEYISGSTKRELTYKNLIGEDGDITTMADTGMEEKKNGYDKFLLTDVSARLSEKVQITEVFGEGEIVYYFGRSPMIFSLSGLLIDSPDNSWFVNWLMMYSEVLRGSQTAKNYELLKIVLPNMVLTGTIMSFSWNQNAARDVDIPFSIEFLAKVIAPIPTVSTGLPISNQIAGVNFSKAASFTGQSSINQTKSSAQAVLQSATSTVSEKSLALQNLSEGVQNTFDRTRSQITSFQKPSLPQGYVQTAFYGDGTPDTMFSTSTASLSGIRSGLFAPVYGVLTSLTKIVANTQAEATSLFSAVSLPVRNVIRDVTSISRQAQNLVNAVNSAIPSFGRNVSGQMRSLQSDYKTAIKGMSKSAGVIATAPPTASQSLTNMFKSGTIPANSPFLASSPKTAYARPSLSGGASKSVNKAALLRSIPAYRSNTSNKL